MKSRNLNTEGFHTTNFWRASSQGTIAAVSPSGIVIADLDGSNRRNVPGVAAAVWVDWNPAGDTVVFSSSAIPGNEVLINRTIDNLYRLGANVLFSRIANVHVRGHAAQEELKLMIGLVKPK